MKRWFIAASALAATLIAGSFVLGFRPAAAESFRPLAQILAVVSCITPSPGACQTYTDTKSGAGLIGVSTGGKGLIGQTKFNSTSTTNGQAGVQGQDLSTSGTHDAGVKGSSTRGIGVLGLSSISNAVQGVIGSGVASSNHSGVVGLDSSVSGNTNVGVFGNTTLGEGVLGRSLGSGIGVRGSSVNGVGVNADGGAGLFPALSIVGNGNDLIDACLPGTVNPCDLSHSVLEVDSNGFVVSTNGIFASSGFTTNIGSYSTFSGEFIKNSTCVAGCTVATAAAGRAVTTYASMVSQPTVEDFGEAQLVNGQAYVRLSPDFANVVDQHSYYLVVVTPEGPSRGLYVTRKTPAGFAVMENPGGHSTLAFSYRIMAKPFGATEARLPMVDLPLRSRHMSARAWHPGTLVPVH